MPEPQVPPKKPEAKSGLRTTELYVSVAAGLLPQLIDHLPPTWRAAAITLAGIFYTLSRGLAKNK